MGGEGGVDGSSRPSWDAVRDRPLSWRPLWKRQCAFIQVTRRHIKVQLNIQDILDFILVRGPGANRAAAVL